MSRTDLHFVSQLLCHSKNFKEKHHFPRMFQHLSICISDKIFVPVWSWATRIGRGCSFAYKKKPQRKRNKNQKMRTWSPFNCSECLNYRIVPSLLDLTDMKRVKEAKKPRFCTISNYKAAQELNI